MSFSIKCLLNLCPDAETDAVFTAVLSAAADKPSFMRIWKQWGYRDVQASHKKLYGPPPACHGGSGAASAGVQALWVAARAFDSVVIYQNAVSFPYLIGGSFYVYLDKQRDSPVHKVCIQVFPSGQSRIKRQAAQAWARLFQHLIFSVMDRIL